ncbi:hypothetical protein A2572_04885 [Candidatus Collierbacteria bacterium RIFOXYD1_FULL_40_9]|uniref:Uncharacterized protein n=1 Tax=Candidatus Collierbacteria bacterium RIFOXYD1_FULL_40_9 TaxID=1817731 RepID=A0A1F5FTP1_9BACT|nr:MAG: hypothetical protein A2572_04885 [Candidatus Collierbacteria bacterium RIFOXYD1_FULL_40_9]
MQVPNKNYKDIKQKGLVRWLLLLVLWMLILSVYKGFVQTRRGFLRLDEASLRLETVKRENNELRARLEVVNSEEYKLKIVRDKLRMQKQDEVVVVMPEDFSTISQDIEVVDKPIWSKWLGLLL